MQTMTFFRSAGTAISVGGIAYLVAYNTEQCEVSAVDVAATFALPPVVAFVYALPRPSLGLYLELGIIAVVAFLAGATWALIEREPSVQCEFNLAVNLLVGWISPAIGVALGAILFFLTRWISSRKVS